MSDPLGPDGWPDAGAVGWEACVDGELKAIKYYMREKGMPWSFARLAFNVGLSAYMTARQEMPESMPSPFGVSSDDQKWEEYHAAQEARGAARGFRCP